MGDEVRGPIDRELQRELLLHMRDRYPRPIRELPGGLKTPDDRTVANLLYLEQHGLCVAGLVSLNAGGQGWSGSRITARGLDFLEDDGGLSAILGIVTVRLHAETVRELIAAKIEALPIHRTEKSALRKHLDGLSETALRAATTDLVQTGLRHLPDAIQWLRTLAGA